MWVRRMNNAITHYPVATMASYLFLSFLVPLDLAGVMHAAHMSLPSDVTLAYGLSLVMRSPRLLLDAALTPILAAAIPRLRDVHFTRGAFSIMHQPLPEDRPGGRVAFAATPVGRLAAFVEKYGMAGMLSVKCLSPLLMTGGLVAALRSQPAEAVKAAVVEWCSAGIHKAALYRHLIDPNTQQTAASAAEPSATAAADAAAAAADASSSVSSASFAASELYGTGAAAAETVMDAAAELSAVLASAPSTVAAAGLLSYAMYPATLYASCIIGTAFGRWRAGLPLSGLAIIDTTRPPLTASEGDSATGSPAAASSSVGGGTAPLDPAAALAGIGDRSGSGSNSMKKASAAPAGGNAARSSAGAAADKKAAQALAAAAAKEASAAARKVADAARMRLEPDADAQEEQLHRAASAAAAAPVSETSSAETEPEPEQRRR